MSAAKGQTKGKGSSPGSKQTAAKSLSGVQVVSRDARPAKVGRRKVLVRGAGVSRTPGAYGHEAAPRSFREGVERSLVDKATNLFRMSLKQMTSEQIQRAIAAPTPMATVVEVLNAAPEIGLARETATTRALARGAAAKQEMIRAADGCLSSGEVAKLLGKTVSAVNQRRARGQILAVPLSGGEWGFPARQFASGDLRSGIAEIVSAAGTMNPWVLLSILLDRVPGSDATLIDSLDRPEVLQDVLTRIHSYGQHGAS
jgi:hypothetical protein